MGRPGHGAAYAEGTKKPPGHGPRGKRFPGGEGVALEAAPPVVPPLIHTVRPCRVAADAVQSVAFVPCRAMVAMVTLKEGPFTVGHQLSPGWLWQRTGAR